MGHTASALASDAYSVFVPPDANGPRENARPRQIQPLDPPMVPFAVGGIVIWAIAGLVLLGFRPALAESGREDWLWICVAGFLLGFPGLYVMLRHDAKRRRHHQDRIDHEPGAAPGRRA